MGQTRPEPTPARAPRWHRCGWSRSWWGVFAFSFHLRCIWGFASSDAALNLCCGIGRYPPGTLAGHRQQPSSPVSTRLDRSPLAGLPARLLTFARAAVSNSEMHEPTTSQPRPAHEAAPYRHRACRRRLASRGATVTSQAQLRQHRDVGQPRSAHHGITTGVSFVHYSPDFAMVLGRCRRLHCPRCGDFLWHDTNKKTRSSRSCRGRCRGCPRGSR